MILTCPSCATRYQADEAKFPAAGRQVRCAKCGQSWHQPGPATMAPAESEPESEPGLLAPRFAAPAESRPRATWLSRLGIAAGWVGLIVVVLLIGLSAERYRQEITVIWPQSAGVYAALGLDVNAHGVDFRDVTYHYESEQGQRVLVVTGAIVNNGTRELPVPQTTTLILSDAANHELYHWNIASGVATLKPKQSVPLLTRLSSPPAAARHLEVRFAKEDP